MAMLICASLVGPGRVEAQRGENRRRNVGAIVAPVRLMPDSSTTTAIEGLSSYYGTIQLKAADDGLVVINRLSLERYLLGLNEVPTTWPIEALRAQAVAARTYALRTLGRPHAGAAATYGFDICASVQCQVFSGADVLIHAERGDRWAAAVADTEGLAILHEGDPILARYHSTSGGRTFDNEQIFPSEGPFPYLKGVRSTTERRSPLYRWRLRFGLRELTRILRHGGLWPQENGRLTNVRTVPSSTGRHFPDVILQGRRGQMRVTAEQVRVVVRSSAPALFPNRYPPRAPTRSGRLPEVFPSNRLEMATRGREVRVVGRGWGHGVGMSQWGAEGMARAGASFRQILDHYYTGVEIARVPDPGRIAVGVDWGRSEVRATGSFRIVNGRGRVVVRAALGSWRFTPAGSGAVRVHPPRGHGLPLEVGVIESPDEVEPGERSTLVVALSRPARLQAGTVGRGTDPGARIRNAGRRRVVWVAPSTPGSYEVRVVASTRRGRASETVPVEVREPPPLEDQAADAPRAPGDETSDGSALRLGLAALLILITVALATAAVTMRR